MSTGVTGGSTGSLIVQKTARGIVVKNAPQTHTFPPKFLDRELNKAARLRLIIPSEPPVVYEITAFEGTRHPETGELTGSYCLAGHLLPPEAVPTPTPNKKKRWFRRS